VNSLFDPGRLRLAAREHLPAANASAKGLGLIQHLIARKADGTLAALSEARIEQSFNERLFSEIFGYRTLFRDGKAHYHLRPKGYNRKSGRYDDFSLGFFRPRSGSPLGVVELKDPGTDLDEPQRSGRYRGVTPVVQAHRQAEGATSTQWVVVSNFDEMRLYRAGVIDRCERIVLSEVLSATAFSRAHSLFSRETLLGKEGAKSPLERIYSGGSPMDVPSRPNTVRLIQSAIPLAPPDEPFALPKMHDALKYALQGLPVWARNNWLPVATSNGIEFDEDRLFLTFGQLQARVEFTTAGVLHLSERLPETDDRSITPTAITQRTAMFLLLAATTTGLLAKGYLQVAADLLDLDGAWLRPEGITPRLRTGSGVNGTHAPPRQRSLEGNWSQAWATPILETVGELLFPFEARELEKVTRFLPTKEQIQRDIDAVR
jgi:hypothetical protein